MKTAAPLQITFKSSRRLLLIEWAAHLLVVGAVFAASLSPGLTALLLLVPGASLIGRRRLLEQHGVLLLRGDGHLEKFSAGDTADELVLHPHSTVLPFLVVLLYRKNGRNGHIRSLVLLSDSCSRDDFRQLRLWLRWRAAKLFVREI